MITEQTTTPRLKNSPPLPRRVIRLEAIALEILWTAGIRGVILDLDNTIVSEDDRYLSPGAEKWIAQAQQQGFRIVLLSNSKRHHRIRYWADRLHLPAISPARKPLPWNFWQAMQRMQLSAREIIVIGDSWHTDIIPIGGKKLPVDGYTSSTPKPPSYGI
jgi:uncharacterized protein